ncbi:MAG TPA: sugar-transfer associated ATP-grasp domain-containing protein [Sphingomonas sp.]
MGYDRFYFLKKAYALYPGVVRPVSAAILAPYYDRRRAARGAPRALLDAIAGLAFLAWVPWRARAVQRKFGLDAAWRRRAIAIARAHFADPNDVALFRITRAEAFDAYIRRYEDAALNKIVNPLGWTADCALADKARFAARCRAADLPHPATIALVSGGQVEWLAEPDGGELVAKPTDGEGGDGVRMLGPVADRAALAAVLGTPRGIVVVQPRVAVHPALADVALAALPTVRIVTILDERGAPEVVSATVRLPSDPAAHVDNMKAGGLLAPVDLAEGMLGLACKGYGGGDYRDHPVTGAAIVGRRLPDWAASKALAVRAHAEAFADYAMIGWDIAMTPGGPLLIEGNGKPGVLMPQRAARCGLCHTRYGVLLAHHLLAAS